MDLAGTLRTDDLVEISNGTIERFTTSMNKHFTRGNRT